MNGMVLTTDFKDLKLYRRGKVRDVYDLGDQLLVVSCDRISCFDVVLPCGIPQKGQVLNQISTFWFEFVEDIIRHHLITVDTAHYPPQLKPYVPQLRGRSMLVRKTEPLRIECVIRGYLSGSGWKEYQESQSICGIRLPAGLQESDKLPEPLFTPSTKEDAGHDINVDQVYVEKLLGNDIASQLKEASLAIYKKARDYAVGRGIIIADTKFEFGVAGGEIILIDELLTPDSSRFWPLDEYARGRSQPSFDKQFVRDYLEGLRWNKRPPAPNLPAEIIQKTTEKYLEAFHRLTGREFVAQ